MHACVQCAVGPIEQSLEVEALQRSRNHPEIRQRRIATPDVRRVQEDSAEAVSFGHLFHQRTGIGDGNEVLARAIALDLAHAIEEILVEHQRLGCRARLACHGEQRMRKIDSLFKTLYSRRVCTVEHVKRREPFVLAEGPAKNFRAQAASAHPEEHHVEERARSTTDLTEPAAHPRRHVEPSEPVRDLRLNLGVVGPQ